MPDSAIKLPQNRIHLFDPVGLINDGYPGYSTSGYDLQPKKTAPKSYEAVPEINVNKGMKPYDSFSMEIKSGELNCYNHHTEEDGNNNSSITTTNGDHVEFRSREIPMYTAISLTNRSYDHGVKETNNVGLSFGVDSKVEDEDHDVSTLRLWRPGSPPSPKAMGSPLNPNTVKSINSFPLNPTSPRFPTSPRSLGSPLHPSSPRHMGYPPMSPNSRTQAIARGRKELMEMVRDLPESYYELSLRDIVEQKQNVEVQKEVDPPEEEEKKTVKEAIRQEESKDNKKNSKKVKKRERKKMATSKSVDNGKFLLKTSVFPILMGSKKSKKNLGASGSFKIAPVPKPKPTPTRTIKGSEREWWRRRSCMSSESEESNGLSSSSTSSGSSRSSSRSNSNSSDKRRSRRFLPTCCFFNGRILRRIRNKK